MRDFGYREKNLHGSKEFGRMTCQQIVSLTLEAATGFIHSCLKKAVHHLGISLQGLRGGSGQLRSSGLKLSIVAGFLLTLSEAFANNAMSSNGSINYSRIHKAIICSEIIGNVFDDLDNDDYQDPTETGLQGIRMITQNGLQLITDSNGRFTSGCIAFSDGSSHSTFVLKLDLGSLQQDHFIKAGNPREIILGRGKVVKLSFAVSRTRIVQLSLRSSAFESDAIKLKEEWAKGIDNLIEIVDAQPSVLILRYVISPQDLDLAKRRMSYLRFDIEVRRKRRNSAFKLPIEIRLISIKDKVSN